MRVVIPSRKRPQTILGMSWPLFPNATVLVDEAERQDYLAAGIPAAQLACHPGLKGLGPIRKWTVDHFDDEIIVMADDDVLCLGSFVGWRWKRFDDPDVVEQVLENAAEIAKGIGAHVFGFSQSCDIRKVLPQDPMTLGGRVGGVVGFIKPLGFQIDDSLSLHTDVDTCLQSLMLHRIIFTELRWGFIQIKSTNVGGNTILRSTEREEWEKRRLKSKWGKYVNFRSGKQKERTTVSVPRKQSLQLSQ